MSIHDVSRARELLDLALPENDSGADTVRGYLIQLLRGVWDQGEGFSGKRPFGNSGWHFDLYEPMVKAGFTTGVLDDEDQLDRFNDEARAEADALVLAAINELGRTA